MPGTSVSRWNRPWSGALLVFLCALCFRGLYLREARTLPDFALPLVDAGYHDYWAWGIASGEWNLPPGVGTDPRIQATPYFRPPLVAYWMAGLFALFGHDHVAARAAWIVLGSLTCVLAWALARRLFDEWTGLVAGLSAASYWVLVYFDLEYREVSLLAFLFLALLLTLVRWAEAPGPRRAALAGVCLGLATLAKPNALVALPLVGLWMAWATRGRLARRSLVAHGSWLVGVTLACVAPVTARNALAGGDLALVSTNGGINLYIGNNPSATGLGVDLPPDLPRFDSAFDYPEIVRAVEARVGRPLAHSAVSRWFAGQAWSWMREHPLAALRLAARKALAFFGGAELLSEKDLVASRRASTVLNVVPLGFASVLASALLGVLSAFLARRGSERGGEERGRRAALVLVLGFVVAYWLSFLPFFVTARYRAPIVPLLLVFSAHAVRRVALWARAGRWDLALGGAGLVALLAFLNRAPERGGTYDPAPGLIADGARLALAGKTAEAERAFREALASAPRNAEGHSNLGLLLSQLGRTGEAIAELRRALELDPESHRAHLNLGLALLATDAVPEAVEHFDRALALEPLDAELPRMAGAALRAKGRLKQARRFLERAVELAPDSVPARSELGLAWLGLEDARQALPHLERATELAPQSPWTWNALGVARLSLGERERAADAFERALERAPADEGIRANLELARRGE